MSGFVVGMGSVLYLIDSVFNVRFCCWYGEWAVTQ